MATELDYPHPIFIGGMGRSGTHAIGKIVGADPRYHRIETELRMHATEDGLADVVEGKTSVDDFIAKVWSAWWERGFWRPQGLHKVIDREPLEAALAEFKDTFERDRVGSARRLMDRVIERSMERSGRPSFVELTGRSILYAPTLLKLWPEAAFINMVRDGRDLAGAHVAKVDMTSDPFEALERWERMTRASYEVCSKLPDDKVLVLRLDDLTYNRREETFQQVVDFLKTEDPEPMRRWFDEKITATKAHIGGYKSRLRRLQAWRINLRYRRIVRDLQRDGIDWVSTADL
jgi:hypothetical protein